MSDAVIRTRAAMALDTDHLFAGHAIFAELAGAETLAGLTALAIMRRRIDPAARDVLDDVAVVTAVADPRIWPVKVARVLASYGSFVAGCFGGCLALEEMVIGPWSGCFAAHLLSELATELGSRVDDEDAVRAAVRQRVEREARLPGFGVPLREHDERLEALRACIGRRGRDAGRFWRLMEITVRVAHEERGLKANINIGVAAAMLDVGFTPDEIGPVMVCLPMVLFAVNAHEGAQQRSAFLRDMPREHVRYVGAPPRVSPRARAVGR